MQNRLCEIILATLLTLHTGLCLGQVETTVETISGQKFNGQLQKIDTDGNFVGDGFDGVNLEQVLSISSNRQTVTSNANTTLGLANGGTLFVSDVTVDGESISIGSSQLGLTSIALQSVRSIVFREDDLIREAIQNAAADKDTVIVAKESALSRVAGVLESLDSKTIQFNFKGKSRPINREKRDVVAIVIADLGMASPKGTIATASFVDGSSVKGALVGLDEASVQIQLTGNQVISIARELLVRIDIASDSIAFLSTLQPVEERQQPQFTIARKWQRNRSIDGNPIRLLVKKSGSENGEASQIQTFDNGIGTSSYSRLVFENTNDFSRFLATVGIDAETEGRGDCEMRVEGDGITLWSQRVRGSDAAIDIDVDISGISQVVLIVEHGEQFDLADHADWARARFLKTE